MKEIPVRLGNDSYDIRIESGLFGHLTAEIRDLIENKKVGVITDSNVEPLYAKTVKETLLPCASDVLVVTVDAGEESKSPECAIALIQKLLQFGLTRDGLLVALGGGVIGDLTGFVASVFLRGIPYVAIPTTLLAQVDSSVGGKTAVNLPEGKNLVGTFYQPKRVLVDPDCLKTLDEREFSCGMAEVIKYGVIRDAKLFAVLEECEDFCEIADEVIASCCRIKADIVERDERDTGERMLLNFGHTVGHAIEKDAGYGTLSHGAAIAIGMYIAARYGEDRGLTEGGTAERIASLCRKFGLPTDYPCSQQLLSGISYDKKNFGNHLELVLAEKIGHAYLKKIEREALTEELKRIW